MYITGKIIYMCVCICLSLKTAKLSISIYQETVCEEAGLKIKQIFHQFQ